MSIVRIDATRITQVEQLWQRSRHLYQNIGHEDLPAMLDRQIALLGEEQAQIWGFLCVQSETRPLTLPATAATRAYIRGVALAPGRSPIEDVPRLLNAAAAILPDYASEHMLTVYGDQRWLNKALHHAGFAVEEDVEFFALSRLQRWHPSPHATTQAQHCRRQHPTLTLRACHGDDLPDLAQLDAHTFTPLWHFGVDGLRELLFTGRVQVVTINSTLVGYAAISHQNREAHLARLAVHPAWQGQGLGHLLLSDALQAAKAAGVQRVVLNTQVLNRRSRQLYQSYGFRSTGQVVPVLGKLIA